MIDGRAGVSNATLTYLLNFTSLLLFALASPRFHGYESVACYASLAQPEYQRHVDCDGIFFTSTATSRRQNESPMHTTCPPQLADSSFVIIIIAPNPAMNVIRLRLLLLSTLSYWSLLLPLTEGYNWKRYCDVSFYNDDIGGQCDGGDVDLQGMGHSQQQIPGDLSYMCGSDAKCIGGGIVECCVDLHATPPELGSIMTIPDKATRIHFQCHVGMSHALCQTNGTFDSREWFFKIAFPITICVALLFLILVVYLLWVQQRRRARAVGASDGDTVKTCDDVESIKDDDDDASITSSLDRGTEEDSQLSDNV